VLQTFETLPLQSVTAVSQPDPQPLENCLPLLYDATVAVELAQLASCALSRTRSLSSSDFAGRESPTWCDWCGVVGKSGVRAGLPLFNLTMVVVDTWDTSFSVSKRNRLVLRLGVWLGSALARTSRVDVIESFDDGVAGVAARPSPMFERSCSSAKGRASQRIHLPSQSLIQSVFVSQWHDHHEPNVPCSQCNHRVGKDRERVDQQTLSGRHPCNPGLKLESKSENPFSRLQLVRQSSGKWKLVRMAR